jgi:hypothetical protein
MSKLQKFQKISNFKNHRGAKNAKITRLPLKVFENKTNKTTKYLRTENQLKKIKIFENKNQKKQHNKLNWKIQIIQYCFTNCFITNSYLLNKFNTVIL